MSNRLPLALGLTSIVVCAAFSAPWVENLLKPGEHESLGKQLAGFFEANAKQSGTDKAFEKVSDELKKIENRVKRSPLALPSDLGKAFWASYDYEKKANALKKGGVKELSCPKPKYGEDAKEKLTYALWAPAKYDARKAWPLLILVGDKGQKPSDHITEKWTDAAVRDGAVLAAVTMPEGDVASWIELATQDGDGKVKDGGLSNVLAVYFDVRKLVAIDFDRVYLVGSGEGVRTVCAMGARFPDFFAGVAGRSGDTLKELAIEPYRNLPTLFAGAGGNATDFAKRLTDAKYDNSTLKPEAKEADIWAWIQDHPRVSNPVNVVISAPPQTQTRAYWVQVPQFDAAVHVEATVDRGTNTITIDADGATEVILFLNDTLVDLDKEIKFKRNGTETVEKVVRNLQTALNTMARGPSDPGKLFVATRRFDIPTKPKPKDKPKDK
ncbi:MAG: hypothetical protein HZA53_18590 [Planctomycetes bacterium]|nr:hypothetical protein [Planctomycetota bacterium]